MEAEGGRCEVRDCAGAAASGKSACLAHLDEASLLDHLQNVRTGRTTLDARGVRLSQGLLETTKAHAVNWRAKDSYIARLERARQPEISEPSTLSDASFEGAVFDGDADFDRLIFSGTTSFRGATFRGHVSAAAHFRGDVSFAGATFEGLVDFTDAIFEFDATFEGAVFQDRCVFTGSVFERKASFRRATFESDVDFRNDEDQGGARFLDDSDFSAAHFGARVLCDRRSGALEGDARFDQTEPAYFTNALFEGAAFDRGALFDGTRFGPAEPSQSRVADFRNAIFRGSASFSGCLFRGRAQFDDAGVEGALLLQGARFDGVASFSRVRVAGDLDLAQARCNADLAFNDAIIGGRTDLTLLTVVGRAWFIRATFEHARDLGPMVAHDKLDLDHASFVENVRVEVAAPRVLCRKTKFRDGVYLLARWAAVSLEEAGFGAPSVLSGAPNEFEGLDEEPIRPVDDVADARPRLMSIRRANVANLFVSNVDLTPCRFARAQNLDRLRLGDPLELPSTPSTIWWTARRTVAEEHLWRQLHHGGRRARGWYPQACELPVWVSDEIVDEFGERPPPPQEIASIYRLLRKGREDSKDEPGAADFYYGEMEMRRKGVTPTGRWSARISQRAEQAVLWVYWLVSGYGLRASRALVSLLVTVGLFALGFWAVGFTTPRSVSDALLLSAQSTTSLFRSQDLPLTSAGEWLSIGLRLLGPLFFGLTILSLRARIKR